MIREHVVSTISVEEALLSPPEASLGGTALRARRYVSKQGPLCHWRVTPSYGAGWARAAAVLLLPVTAGLGSDLDSTTPGELGVLRSIPGFRLPQLLGSTSCTALGLGAPGT